ncbi:MULTISPECIES: PEPxxWA-CTERM sorting domain-containing protein [unclassified Phenylobacterium]|uniref:PEPxxWA-CTERM sorting domain-containing protein n=1 Tax=unclassified Phenylobacterium TaxID=2640670 RepID=UPI000A7A59ED|nr:MULTISPECIES: PEPxxWA-CTERM sorting domain-containing protein [unclassified Phenylobacterium]
MRRITTPVLAVAVSMWASAAGAVVPISGLSQVRTDAFLDGANSAVDSKIATQWSGTPQNGSAFAQAIAYTGLYPEGASAVTHAKNSATWSADGTYGQVNFEWGWHFNADGDYGLMGGGFDGLNPNWSYTFLAERDGRLAWQGEVRPNPASDLNNFGLSGWNLQLNGVTVIDLFDPTGGKLRYGDGDFLLKAGETYTVSLINNSNIAGRTFGAAYDGLVNGVFYWAIEEEPAVVPEPAGWALMIGGFGLVGMAFRRRRLVEA